MLTGTPQFKEIHRRLVSACPLLSILLFVLFSVCGQADVLVQGRELQNEGRLDDAFKLFSDAAAGGDPAGAYGLGVLYYQGTGVPKDMEKSSHWFRVAAEKGHAPAQYNLGNAFLYGRGLSQDLDSAEKWWRKAAQQNYVRAQFNLGSLLYTNGNTAEMREEGIAWCRVAAERGFDKALELLAEIREPVAFSAAEPDPAREPQRGEARLMTLDPTGFTIQLFSDSKSGAAETFIARNQLTGLALRFRFLHAGATWTAVVYGWYADRKEAGETIATLEPALRKANPWIRPLPEVQAKILQARRGADGG